MGGERRFASAAAKRLLSLGALLRGDRNALGAGASLRQFDIETKWGTQALKRLYADVTMRSQAMDSVAIPGGDANAFYSSVRKSLVSIGIASWAGPPSPAQIAAGTINVTIKEADMGNVPRFLNRLLGLPVAQQQDAFSYFMQTFDATVLKAKSSGQWESGIVSLKGESVQVLPGFPRRIHTCPTSLAETCVVKVELDRGVPFASAMKHLDAYKAELTAAGRSIAQECGFYRSTCVPSAACCACISLRL